MPDAVMNSINEDLARHVGGTPLFRSVGAALNKCGSILADHGYEWGEVIPSFQFTRDSGRTAFDIDKSNLDDPFSPARVDDVALSFSWHRFASGRVEAIAYMSRSAPEQPAKRARRR
jgi:hypothetical protein